MPPRTDGARPRTNGGGPSHTDGGRSWINGTGTRNDGDGARTDGAGPSRTDGGRQDGAGRGRPTDADDALLTVLCTEVDFPTPPWRLIVAAHEHGIAASSVARLQRLPQRLYTDPADLAEVLRSTPAPTPSMWPASRHPRP